MLHIRSEARTILTTIGSGCEVWQQDFLKLDLPAQTFDGVFANASLFHVPAQELPRDQQPWLASVWRK